MTAFQDKVLDWAEQAETLYAGHVEIVLIKGVRLALGQLIDQEQNILELERRIEQMGRSNDKITALYRHLVPISVGVTLDQVGELNGLKRLTYNKYGVPVNIDTPFTFFESDESFRLRIMAAMTPETSEGET